MPLFFLLFHTCVGNTPLHSACECLNTNLIAVLSLMLALGPNAAMEKDRDGNLALHSAAESKKLTGKSQTFALDMLIDAYPEACQKKDKDGNLPLHSALKRGDGIRVQVIEKMVRTYPQGCLIYDKHHNLPVSQQNKRQKKRCLCNCLPFFLSKTCPNTTVQLTVNFSFLFFFFCLFLLFVFFLTLSFLFFSSFLSMALFPRQFNSKRFTALFTLQNQTID